MALDSNQTTYLTNRSEVFSLTPVLISFFVPSSGHQGIKAPHWNQVLLFGGMAVSRMGLWSFDLCQLKLLQNTLANHPRRNTLNGLQYSLQNVLDLLKYVMVIVLSWVFISYLSSCSLHFLTYQTQTTEPIQVHCCSELWGNCRWCLLILDLSPQRTRACYTYQMVHR